MTTTWLGEFMLALQVIAFGFQVWALMKQRRLRKQAMASIDESAKAMNNAIVEANAYRDRAIAIAAQMTAKLNAMGWGEDDPDLGPPSRLH